MDTMDIEPQSTRSLAKCTSYKAVHQRHLLNTKQNFAVLWCNGAAVVIIVTNGNLDMRQRRSSSTDSDTACPIRYRIRHFFNNSHNNEDIATKFEEEYVRCVKNEEECVCILCNILISGKIIKEMPGSVASGTPYSYSSQKEKNPTTTNSVELHFRDSPETLLPICQTTRPSMQKTLLRNLTLKSSLAIRHTYSFKSTCEVTNTPA